MLKRWAELVVRTRVAVAMVVAAVVIAGISAPLALEVSRDDDILAFLPKGNADVAEFRRINELYGGLDVAIVGLEVDDPFAPVFLEKLRALTKRLNETPEVAYALSLTNADDFAEDEAGGVRTDYLIPETEVPRTEAAKAALRARVLSKEHYVANIISADATAINIYCFLRTGVDTRVAADAVHKTVNEALPDETKYWGGAPFISSYIYDVSLRDMKRLMPWALVVVLVMVFASFRNVIGTLLALAATGLSIGITYGTMGIAGVNANIVLSSMPVILFAIGSAYPIHILVHYFELARGEPPREAMARTLREVGPPVLVAGLTTMAGIMSFVVMDIAPIREFGVFTAIGVFSALLLSFTLIPAVVVLTKMKGRSSEIDPIGRLLGRVSRRIRGARLWFAGVLAVVVVAGVAFAGRVDARMEAAAFFETGSPPDRAEAFLKDRFGGSQFIQVEVGGDMTDPDVLREVVHLADEILVLPHVSAVNHIGVVLGLANESWDKERRVPLTSARVKSFYQLLAGKLGVRILVTDDHEHALIHAKIDSDRVEDVGPLLTSVEELAKKRTVGAYVVGKVSGDQSSAVLARNRELAVARIVSLAKTYGIELGPDAPAALEASFAAGGKIDLAELESRVERFMRSDESVLDEDEYVHAGPLAAAVVALGARPPESGVRQAIAAEFEVEPDSKLARAVFKSLAVPLDEAWRQASAHARTHGVLAALGIEPGPGGESGALRRHGRDVDPRFGPRVADALLDLDRPSVLLPAPDGVAPDGELRYTVSGQPVLNRGLSHSVTSNQLLSLASSLGLVLVIMVVVFRSFWSGLLGIAPCALTLLAVYGTMGALGIHLDIGTSLLASIIVGAGVDFGVHLTHAWRAAPGEPLEAAAERAAAHSGTAIWTNALTVGAGFFVLTLGQAKPLKNVGGLTAAAMVAAAVMTFVAIPVLARKRRYALLGASAASDVAVEAVRVPATQEAGDDDVESEGRSPPPRTPERQRGPARTKPRAKAKKRSRR